MRLDRALIRRNGIGWRKRPILKSSSRRFHSILLTAYVLAIIWTSLTYGAEYRVTGSPIPASIALLKATPNSHAATEEKAEGSGRSISLGTPRSLMPAPMTLLAAQTGLWNAFALAT